MTDVSKIHGPSGPAGDSGKKEKSSADMDKFKDEMRKRVNEVGKIDPDEKKKRKQREEGDEEDFAAPQQGTPTPADQVTPFSLEKEAKKISPADMQKEGPGVSPLKAAQPTPPNARPSFFQALSSEELSDDSGMLEEESFRSPPSYGSAPQPGVRQQSSWNAGAQNPPIGPPESNQQYPESRPSQPSRQSPVGPPQTRKEERLEMPQKIEPPSKQRESQGYTAESLKDTQEPKEQDALFFEQMGKDKEGQKSEVEEKKSEETEAGNFPITGTPSPTPFSAIEEEKTEDKDKIASPDAATFSSGSAEPQLVPPAAPAPESLPPYALLNPQIQEMFDRMVGVMTVMTQSGMTETTFTLNSPQFASSVFFGTQIIIQEFSTAPQAFNIQINGAPQAIGLLQNNADELMAAFQAGNYGFRVNRLETG